MTTAIKPILKYPGAKWNLAEWIISHFPPHQHYVEPFFGSGAVFFNKAPAKHEVINDLSGDVVNLFRVIRERGEELAALIEMTPWAREEYESSYEPCKDELERARRFVVRAWQAYGQTVGERVGWKNQGTNNTQSDITGRWRRLPAAILMLVGRMKKTEIDNRPAVEIIKRVNSDGVLIYADPPYPLSTRKNRLYQHEMTDQDHAALLNVLDAHPGPVVLSGYHCPLYDDRLKHWHAVEKQAQVEKGNTRIETLWLNDAARPQQLRML